MVLKKSSSLGIPIIIAVFLLSSVIVKLLEESFRNNSILLNIYYFFLFFLILFLYQKYVEGSRNIDYILIAAFSFILTMLFSPILHIISLAFGEALVNGLKEAFTIHSIFQLAVTLLYTLSFVFTIFGSFVIVVNIVGLVTPISVPDFFQRQQAGQNFQQIDDLIDEIEDLVDNIRNQLINRANNVYRALRDNFNDVFRRIAELRNRIP